jgi:excisionase family DNA binding protein
MRKLELGSRRVLRVTAAAAYLSTSARCVRSLVQRGELPIVKLSENGHSPWLLDVRDLDALIERRKVVLQ